MTLLQVVAITEGEMNAMMCWDGEMFLTALEEYYPFCVTELLRNSMMENPDFYKIWQEGMKKDGSSTAFLYMDELGVRLENDHITIRLGAGREYTDKYVKSKSGQRQGTVC